MYSEDYLLDRIYQVIGDNGIKGKINMPKPDTMISNKKTFLKNYTDILKRVDREYIISFSDFIKNELTSDVSVNEKGELVICGIFRPTSFEKIIRDYCLKYIQCKSCKGGDTKIIKDNKITYIDCQKCKSKLAVE